MRGVDRGSEENKRKKEGVKHLKENKRGRDKGKISNSEWNQELLKKIKVNQERQKGIKIKKGKNKMEEGQ